MTAIFISYERSAAAVAKRMADQLRAGGREVWLDADLPPHRAYSEVIEEKLAAAGAVLVLWSKAAAASEWVRAEAGFARERRKLVQVSLDGARPPIPFDQTHCESLKGWRGADTPGWRKVLNALDELVAREPSSPKPATPRRGRGLTPLLAGVALLVLLAAGLWIARDRMPGHTQPRDTGRVAILPFRVDSQTPAAHDFAASLGDQIQSALTDGQIQAVSRADAEALAGPDRERRMDQLGVRLVFDGAVQDDGKTTEVTVHLNEPAQHVTLWSSHFTGASGQPALLQAEIGGRIVAVLTCSSRALNPRDGLTDPQVLAQYLLACDLFARSGEDDQQMTFKMLSALRQVTRQAPRFPPAHAALAKFLAYSAPTLPPDQAAAFRTEARQSANKAIALDPKNADAYVALELLEPADHWALREALLRKGLAGEPDFPHANGFLAQVMSEVGRLDEAAAYGRKAASQASVGETWGPTSTAYMIAAGQTGEADAVLEQAEATSSDSTNSWSYLFSARTNEGRWADALALLDRPIASRVMSPAGLAARREYLRTVAAPSPAGLARQRTILLAQAGGDLNARASAISNLARLGLLDDAFKVAEGYTPGQAMTGGNSEFLFRPATAAMRRDPRFWTLATRIGLVDYWRKSGHWPDYCREPNLPYVCK